MPNVPVEEEYIRSALKGVWTRPEGCPHIHLGNPDQCDALEMSACFYETYDVYNEIHCEIFYQIILELKEEYGL